MVKWGRHTDGSLCGGLCQWATLTTEQKEELMNTATLPNGLTEQGRVLTPKAQQAWNEFYGNMDFYRDRFQRCRAAFLKGLDAGVSSASQSVETAARIENLERQKNVLQESVSALTAARTRAENEARSYRERLAVNERSQGSAQALIRNLQQTLANERDEVARLSREVQSQDQQISKLEQALDTGSESTEGLVVNVESINIHLHIGEAE